MARYMSTRLYTILVAFIIVACNSDGGFDPWAGEEDGRELEPLYSEDHSVEFEGREGIGQTIEFLTERQDRLKRRLESKDGRDEDLERHIQELERQIAELQGLLSSGSED